eukprot:1159203-Pelagomonas_calceolata.AAC.4
MAGEVCASSQRLQTAAVKILGKKTKQAQEDPPPFTHSAIPPLPAVAAAEGNDALQQMHAS